MEVTAAHLNAALSFTLEWGQNFGKPILERMKEEFPELSDDIIGQLEASAQKVKFRAFSLFEEVFHKRISSTEAGMQIREMFPGISAENLSKLETQGMYYAWHG